ncbi:hypothetical protein TNCV_1391101 [Trichonephila clavipes]|nr:hypothetical protein TNCV_1391101 [Trichonephila clavipes]
MIEILSTIYRAAEQILTKFGMYIEYILDLQLVYVYRTHSRFTVERRLSERLLSGASNIWTSFFCQQHVPYMFSNSAMLSSCFARG